MWKSINNYPERTDNENTNPKKQESKKEKLGGANHISCTLNPQTNSILLKREFYKRTTQEKCAQLFARDNCLSESSGRMKDHTTAED
jgi:hypothetical protein